MRLFGKVAIITGSSSGLGRAIALVYASHGTRLIVCADLNPDAPRDVIDGEAVPTHELICARYGSKRAVFQKTDVANSKDVESCVIEAVKLGGRLDIVVNNAGLGTNDRSKRVHLMDEETWDMIIRVNLRGVFLGCKFACGQFLKQELGQEGRRGWIINTSSMLGMVGITGGASAYCASKGAVANLTKQVALDYAKDRIHCNALCPGFMKTPMTRVNYEDEQVCGEMATMTPWGDWGSVDDVAKAAVFLASNDAAWVTGVLLPVDGGYLAQ